MNFSELVTRISELEGVPKTTVDKVLKTFIKETRNGVEMGREISLPGLGKFVKKKFKEKKVKLFGSPDYVTIPEKSMVGFKVSFKGKF